MGKGQGLFRRAWVGAFVVGMVLAFSLPSIALAANTATFKSPVPAAGSSTSNTRPTISLIGYDRYGVRASGISMWVGGVRVTPKFTYNNLGNKSFRLSYAPAAPLSSGAHRVTVKVHDLRHLNSTYSWVFTTGEAVAPVTTSNAVTGYTDKATIFLFATDNAGGSGVAHTYYTLDGFAGEGAIVYTAAAGHHTLVFWSVDAAGNVEAKHTVAFTVAKDMLTNAWHQKTTGFCVTSGCHFSSLTVEHYQHADAAGALLTCFTCHDSTDPKVVATIAARSDACERCHGNTTNHIGNHTTVVPPTAVVNCIQAGCHTGNLIAIHVNAKSGTMVSCGVCHANPDHAATNDCTVCHGTSGPHSGSHAVISSVSTGTATCTQAAPCHGTSVVAVHPNCATCHSPAAGGTIPTATIDAAIASGHATCEACHGIGFFAASHGTGNSKHVVSGSCFVPTCHGTDVTAMHTNDFRGSGETPPGCAACHAAGKTPSTNCTDCHNDLNTRHNYTTAHAGVTTMLNTNSSACVACHGNDVTMVGSRLTANGAVNVPAVPSDPVQEHKGCSCHAYFEAGQESGLLPAGQAGCQNCHTGSYGAIHGFKVSSGTYSPGTWNASGHNTTTFGTVGAFTKWDGLLGRPLVTDSNDATITQEWPLPTAGVFWSQAKVKTGTEAPPATANTTVGWGSVITCQDCHTGLSTPGPHGADQNWGLDPDYPSDWTQGELTSFEPSGMRSIETTVGSPNPIYGKLTTVLKSSTGVTNGVGPNFAISNGYSDGFVAGFKPICAKCHKLVDKAQGIPAQVRLGRSQPGMGWSNEVHMEHHGDQIRGQGNCVSCHVAIPHGWKRPRLLVYSTDVAPYKAPQPANWSYFAAGSAYLDAIDASPAAHKELELDTTSTVGADGVEYTWDPSTGGVLWHGDPAGVIDPESGLYPVQNNCNACGAAGSTHVDPTVEAIPVGSPTWK